MRATGLVLLAVLCALYCQAVPVQVYHAVDTPALDVVILDAPASSEIAESAGTDEDYDWKHEQEFTEGAMGKRSIALGRSGFRPGKRSMDNFHTLDVSGLIMKRSMAIGRLGLRPGKRSMAYGRQGFRPGKRSMAYGRQGFRPGKRSDAVIDSFPSRAQEIYVI